MTAAPHPSGLRVFVTVWIGQVFSIFGSNMTNFALGVWVYQKTGSATKFSLVSLCLTLPGLLVTPLAGALVDRWDRRRSMLLGDGCDALLRLPLLYLAATGSLRLWPVYSIVALSSFFHAFQVPAFAASTALLVPKHQLSQANGWVQAGVSGAQILSPLTAGFLLATIGITGVIATDLVTASLGLVTLLIVRIPRPSGAESAAHRASLWHSSAEGWRYIRSRGGLLRLLGLSGSINFCFGIVYVLLTPLVLSFASSRQLGVVMGTASCGILAGSLAVGAWGVPPRKMHAIFLFLLAQSLVLSITVLRANFWLLAVGAFAYMFFNPIIGTCTRTLLQTKIAPEVQGRVFAFASVIGTSSLPLAAVVAGPLADHVFEPWLYPGGRLAASAGLLLGVGKGRGMAMMCLCSAGIMALLVLLAACNPPLRDLEQQIPDAIPDEQPRSLVQETAPL